MNREIKEINLRTFIEIVDSVSLPLESNRKIIGICGEPGSGKSTLAQYTVAKLNQQHKSEVFAYLPMDGFHMSNDKLNEVKLAHKKGAIETFEVEKYLNVLKAVKAGNPVKAPNYSRDIDDIIENVITIDRQNVVVTEGNYLLSRFSLWKDVSECIDFCFFLHEEKEIVRKRLLARQKTRFLSNDEANRHVILVDMVNYDYVNSLSRYADYVFRLGHVDDFK